MEDGVDFSTTTESLSINRISSPFYHFLKIVRDTVHHSEANNGLVTSMFAE